MEHKKWKVLIVDDEFRIAMLIKKLIKWQELHLECAGVVDNGEAACTKIQETKPDIVITDIRMPKINGLELIAMVKEQFETVRFIVISGYKEFEYARQALQYGVNDYLLKPIDEAELNKVLSKLEQELLDESVELERQHILTETVTANEHIIKRNLLEYIIEKEDTPSEDEVKEGYHIVMDAPLYRGLAVKLDYFNYEETDKKQDSIAVEKITKFIQECFKDDVQEQLICEKDNLYIYCLLNYEAGKAKDIRNNISELLSEIQNYLIGFERYEATIGIGNEKTEFGNIRFSIREANQAVNNRLKLGTGRLIYADLLKDTFHISAADYLGKYQDELLRYVENCSKENMEHTINHIFGSIQLQEQVDFSCCYEIAEELIRICFQNTAVGHASSISMKTILLECYQHCRTITQLKNLLKTYIGMYLDECMETLENKSIKPVRQAKQYIDIHFAKKIVLEDIAAIVDLNPVYFSVLFKKETGLNFSAYLVKVRMDKAKELLCQTNETIAAIAEKTGYQDSRYFSQTFAKIVGVKPALYRRLHS